MTGAPPPIEFGFDIFELKTVRVTLQIFTRTGRQCDYRLSHGVPAEDAAGARAAAAGAGAGDDGAA